MTYLARYKKYLKLRRYSKATIIHYLNDLGLFKSYIKKEWRMVTKEDITHFVARQTKMNCTGKTINRRLYVLRGFYNYLSEELEYNIKNPVKLSHLIRTGRKLPNTLTNEEVGKLLKVITDHRDRAIVLLMIRCGLRVGEVANLELANIDLVHQRIRILGKGNKERVIPLPTELVALLTDCTKIRAKSNPKFFWSKKHPAIPLKINSIQFLLTNYGKKVGIKIHCHMLRHSFAAQLTEKGLERTVLRDLMGHSSIFSTDSYGKLSDPVVRDSYFEAMSKIVENGSTTEPVIDKVGDGMPKRVARRTKTPTTTSEGKQKAAEADVVHDIYFVAMEKILKQEEIKRIPNGKEME